MKTTIMTCDVCKKEMHNTQGVIDLTFSTGGTSRGTERFTDICLVCSTAIMECVHKLEPVHVKPVDELPNIDLLGNKTP